MNIYQFADQSAEFFVEIEQKLVFLFVEGTEIVFVVFEERSIVVGRLNSVPMQVSPVAVVGNPDIFHWAFRCIGLYGGDRESQFTVRSGNCASVTVGLLHIVVVLFYKNLVVCQ